MFVDVPDARLHFESTGSDGTPVLLIMGFGAPGHMWRNQIPALATRHRVAWYDNCGAGKTIARLRRRYTMRDFGRHALAVLDALGWQRAHVVGVSMGGMIAQELALGHAARVRSLSLVTTHPGGLRNLLPSARGVGLFAAGFLGPRKLRARALERLVFPDGYLSQIDAAELRAELSQLGKVASNRGRLLQLGAVASHRAAPRLRQLAGTPTLVVKASQDRLVRPSECHRLHTLIPGSKLVEFEDAGHALVHQCAEQLNQVLLDHFREADRSHDGP